jgi:D-lactate dehydrogenase (cytochrome)
MPGCSIQARPARGDSRHHEIVHDPDRLASVLEDSAHVSGGHAAGLLVATSEADVAWAIREASAVLAIGAQSSLTGGATPRGELVITTSRLNRILEMSPDRVRVEAGITIAELDSALEQVGRYYPPGPTFTGAFVGGTVATNAAGAATFKYGTTRDWVDALTVVLPSGDVLDITRGVTRADPGGHFEIDLGGRTIKVPVATYSMPSVPKTSAGYFCKPGMDLIDLFIGAEGTLGVITEVTLRVVSARPATCLAFVPFRRRTDALSFVRRLRSAARETWRTHDSAGLDISAIEHLDRRSLDILREDAIDRQVGISWPADTAMALLVTLELPAGTTGEHVYADAGRAFDVDAPRTPVTTFCRTLAEFGAADDVEIAVPGDRRRTTQLLQLREAVPAGVNQRIARAKQSIDPRIEKTAADMIVPFDRLEDLLDLYDREFTRRGLDAATWGHISDGNLHPNVIPRSFADVEAGKAAILEFGRHVVQMGGSPLAEHGVGRSAVKQQLLAELYGASGVEQMKRVKRAIDPEWKLAPGVLFER